ncbi:MAG: preprotein translocase subunit YajC [Zetaproteobacteria bacterium]|nr:MAG: preprotein translocase subunit YajC [Zetaproteobacteria bacterium]
MRQTTAAALQLVAVPNLAFAAGGPGAAGGAAGGFASLIPLLLIMAIFYFLLIRPQQKRYKAHREMISGLKKGDRVITAGGIYGKVVDVQEEQLKVEIADGVRVRIKRDTVSSLAD